MIKFSRRRSQAGMLLDNLSAERLQNLIIVKTADGTHAE
jgi:hypothetical protein